METYQQRLKRLEEGSPVESISTLLNSIDMVFVKSELKKASKYKLTNLLLIGIHAVAETISENIYDKKGINGFRFYLERFVDENNFDTQFSQIYKELNDWRNVLTHRWLSAKGHCFGCNYNIKEGWRKKGDGTIVINPRIYFECFNNGFRAGGPMWNYQKTLTSQESHNAKDRIIKQYIK
jgi:hypothetical protein